MHNTCYTVKFHVMSMCSVHIIKLLSLITHSDLTLTAEESSYFTTEPEKMSEHFKNLFYTAT